MMTGREHYILSLVQNDLAKGLNWTDRGLSSYTGEGKITWEEMLWLIEIERQAFQTRIEAMFIVAKEVWTNG